MTVYSSHDDTTTLRHWRYQWKCDEKADKNKHPIKDWRDEVDEKADKNETTKDEMDEKADKNDQENPWDLFETRLCLNSEPTQHMFDLAILQHVGYTIRRGVSRPFESRIKERAATRKADRWAKRHS
jgi:hypothetical protein